jgi:hypothetical protein
MNTMNTTIVNTSSSATDVSASSSTSIGVRPPATPPDARVIRSSAARRYFGVVARPQSYRNLAYLLVGLPLGTVWFTVLVTGVSVAAGMVAVALLGIPMLLGLWYVSRAFANVERATANVLLDQQLAPAPMASSHRGNVWVRLRSMTADTARWREVAYLMLRFPAGIATFTAAVTALAVPVAVASAPFATRYDDDHTFGDWALSDSMERVAASPWSWFLVPLGAVMLFASLHVVNALASACGRWVSSSLRVDPAG